MDTKIITINGIPFAAGLEWMPVATVDNAKELKKVIARQAEEISEVKAIEINYYALAEGDGGNSNLGLACVHKGKGGKTCSLAVAIANYVSKEYNGSRSWVAALQLDEESYWLCVMSNGIILSGTDVVRDLDGIRDLLSEYQLFYSNAEIRLTSEGLGFSALGEATVINIEEAIASAGTDKKVAKQWRLIALKEISVTTKAIFIVVAAAILAGGWMAWDKYQTDKAIEAARIAMLEEQKRHDEKMAAQKMNPQQVMAPKEWNNISKPEAFYVQCRDSISDNLLFAGGWELKNAICENGAMSFSWERKDSTVDHILARIPNITLDSTGNNASLKNAVLVSKPQEEELPLVADIMPRLLGEFQKQGTEIKFDEVAKASPPEVIQPWRVWKFKFGTDIHASTIATILEKYKGVRITKVTFLQNMTTETEGVLYAQ